MHLLGFRAGRLEMAVELFTRSKIGFSTDDHGHTKELILDFGRLRLEASLAVDRPEEMRDTGRRFLLAAGLILAMGAALASQACEADGWGEVLHKVFVSER